MGSTITIAGMIMGLLLVFTVNSAQASELGMPDIIMNTESGPVGSMITINVSNLPMPPADADPRLEFYMYLPASEEYGSQLTPCEGYCIVLYSFDDIRNERVSEKEITFALPSVKNPDPTSVQLSEYNIHYETKVGAVTSSVCDIVINDKIEYKFGYSCNNYDVPVGEYDISFGWAINNSDVSERQTITFTVTDEPYQFKGIFNNVIEIISKDMVGVSSDMILKKFEQGKMLKVQFITTLEDQGFSDKDIRRMLALSRALEHQTQDPRFGTEIFKKPTMFGEVTEMLSDNTTVKIHRSAYVTDNILKLTVMFEKSKFVNYDILVTQNGKIVLNDIGAYSMYGKSVHLVPVLSSIDPLDITITFQGYGVGDGKSGPIGEQVVFANVVVNGVVVVHDSTGLSDVSTEQPINVPITG